jgi:GT2 family glycosyltransferase
MTGAGAPELSVCVAVYRDEPDRNIGTLHAGLAAAADGLSTELVAVANGPGAASVAIPEEAVTVSFPVNRGVTTAWNAAARRARGRVLCFVNDDVLLGPGSLRRLWQALVDHPQAGVVGPVGTQWDIAAPRHVSYLSMDGLADGEMLECDVVSGFLWATRRETYLAADGLDEAYTPCGMEEVDYCTTVRLGLGMRCYAVAGVEHEHEFGISARRPRTKLRYNAREERLGDIASRNRAYFRAKWRPVLERGGGER